MNRLTVLTQYAPDSTPNTLADNAKRAEFTYTLRLDGTRDGATERFWLDGQARTTTLDWTYDNLGRLVDEVIDHYDNTLDRIEHFVYDLVGNRRSQTLDRGRNGTIDEARTYEYDANDRLLIEGLDTTGDGQFEQTTSYGYTGTQQAIQDVRAGVTLLSRTTYAYDLQGRLSAVTAEAYTANVLAARERTTYAYDADGIRVSALHEVDANADDTFETATETAYLNDGYNPTGYSQVLRETTTDAATGQVQQTIVYTLGHDQISQTTTEYTAGLPGTPQTLVFGHDGHGSTRLLTTLNGAIATVNGVRQVFTYSAYGTLLNMTADQAATSLLYSGEMTEVSTGLQYLRARWYDPNTGRFGSFDPFFGNLQDPQGGEDRVRLGFWFSKGGERNRSHPGT